MTPVRLKNLLLSARPVVGQVSDFIKSQKELIVQSDILVKDANSLVTYVDKTAEEMLVDGLGKLLPQATFITEEDTVPNSASDFTWIIDPLDGTTNFILGVPIFSISVALMHEGEMVIGIVDGVMQNEYFEAWKGGGAYLNDRRLVLQSPLSLDQAIIATGFPYNDAYRTEGYINILRSFLRTARGIRRLGSAALDLAYVAAGRFGAYYEQNLNIWDLAAGALLVKEAGGMAEGFQEPNGWMTGETIVAAHPSIFDVVQETINKSLAEIPS